MHLKLLDFFHEYSNHEQSKRSLGRLALSKTSIAASFYHSSSGRCFVMRLDSPSAKTGLCIIWTLYDSWRTHDTEEYKSPNLIKLERFGARGFHNIALAPSTLLLSKHFFIVSSSALRFLPIAGKLGRFQHCWDNHQTYIIPGAPHIAWPIKVTWSAQICLCLI